VIIDHQSILEIDFLTNQELRDLVNDVIDKHADLEYTDDPERAAREALERKDIVNTTLAVVEGHDSSQRVMLLAFWKFFGGNQWLF